MTYKVKGGVEHGILHLRPAPASCYDADELRAETLAKLEPKGWGRHVASMVWSCLALEFVDLNMAVWCSLRVLQVIHC